MRPLTLILMAALCAGSALRAYRRGRAARPLARWRVQPPPERWPSVSIIIPAWQERGTLEGCLTSLRAVEYADYEVIIVAGGPDGTQEAARRLARSLHRCRVIPQRPAAGKNGAMNDAARIAQGEVLVFLDADSIVAPGWLAALIAALGSCERGDAYAASTGRFTPSRSTLIARVGEMSQVLEYQARGRVSLQGSSSMAVRREAWDAIGEIPEGIYADDWDLNARLRHARMRVSHAPDALVCSERPATVGEWWDNELRWRRVHLSSLIRVARAEMPNAWAAAQALYPYAIGWSVLALGAGALAGSLSGARGAAAARLAWASLTTAAVMREVAGAVETWAYTGDAHWLVAAPALPLLTLLSWCAAALASLSPGRAPIHFKGPRERTPAAAPRARPAVDSEPCQAILIDSRERVRA